ncbi:MAG: molybdopterin-dependent oxidoreductase [Pirellulales bacterium]
MNPMTRPSSTEKDPAGPVTQSLMEFPAGWLDEHVVLARRHFLASGLAGMLGAGIVLRDPLTGVRRAIGDETAGLGKVGGADDPALVEPIGKLGYFTADANFGTVERGTPLPYTHPLEKLREVGMTRETWRLEVVPDPESNAKVANPLSREKGTALDFETLVKLGETKGVRFTKIMTCNNGGAPLGMGLWEGVPLREVIWMARPEENVRRLFYHGYHNDDPKQIFRSSLPIGRVLEDPPGEHPVTLCYKLNGEWLSGKRGGPVRMLVPEAYGFKSVKWLQKVTLTNAPFANDTYADGNNDVDSWMKTFARFVSHSPKVSASMPITVTGMAQVGISGLTKVQVWLKKADEPLEKDDPHFTKAPWVDASLLAAPSRWQGLPDEKLPAGTLGFDNESQRPLQWPMRYTLAHWAAVIRDVPSGKYELRCRTIDARGIAQPMPRPFPKSGRNSIQQVSIEVT